MLGLVALMCAALGQDIAPDDEALYEVLVVGDRVERARRETIAAFEAAGWRHVGRSDGADVFRGPRPWTGKARLTTGGSLVFRGRPVQFEYGLAPTVGTKPLPPEGVHPFETISRDLGGLVPSVILKSPDRRRLGAVRARLATTVEPQVRAYRRAIQVVALEERLGEVVTRLDRLWSDGTPLEPGPTLETWESRRAAVLAFWANRTDTREGRAVRDAVEQWLAMVVQPSPHPVTPDEVERATEAALHGGHLSLPMPASDEVGP